MRHIREGIVENNRSKARLIEAVHDLCGRLPYVHYFPAYELLIDVLRDYRYYDIDMVHPNFTATSYVWERFTAACIHPDAYPLMQEIKEINTAFRHRPRFPETDAHQQFLQAYASKCRRLQQLYPSLDWTAELEYFDA